MNIKLFRDDALVPTKSHSTDAGYDMYVLDDFTIKSLETVCLGTGVGFQLEEGSAGFFIPRSSTEKKGIICQMAATDAGYTGETHLIVTNCSNNVYEYKRGDRIMSFIAVKLINEPLTVVSEFPKSERGDSGLGSSGK